MSAMTENINAREAHTATLVPPEAQVTREQLEKALHGLSATFGENEVFALLQRFGKRTVAELRESSYREVALWAYGAALLDLPPSSPDWTVGMLCEAEREVTQRGWL